MTAHLHSIASGKPYLVTGVPDGLEQLVGDAEFTIDGVGGPLRVIGHGVPMGEVVRFQEKDGVGGKDVRVWHIRQQGEGLVAESVAAF